jgi:FG-GAP-like repeat
LAFLRRESPRIARIARIRKQQIASCSYSLCDARSQLSTSGPISEGVRPREKFDDFQKSLDAISRFAAKGCSPDDVYTCTRDVKKQISPPVKAHLLRSALILLSLVTFNQNIFCQTPTPTATVTPSPTATECPRPTPGSCTSYEAESSNNRLEGSAFVLSCPTCSGGFKVGYVGSNSGTLQFNGVGVVAPGNHTVTICYTNGDATRNALLSVNGGPGMPVSFPSTGSFQTVGSKQITITLNTGCNTLKFYNPIVGNWAPDFDRIQFNCPTCTVPTPTPTPALARRATVGDFNGDRHPDWVLRNAGTSQTAIWYLNNNVFIGGAFGPSIRAGWVLESVTDFNQDSHPDYALFNPTTDQTALWYMSGPTFIGSAYGPSLPDNWELVETGDFNANGYPDYVLYNANTRQTAIWYLHNNIYVIGAYGPTLRAAWNLVGVADFDGDGQKDYLLFNPGNHQTAIWYLSGPTFVRGAFGPNVPSGWALVAAADFNGDGLPDYLLYNPVTRQTAIWYMNNNVYVIGVYGRTLPVGWNLVGQ